MREPTKVHLSVIAKPFGRIAMIRFDILQSDREVDKEEIEIINAPEFKLMLRKRFDL